MDLEIPGVGIGRNRAKGPTAAAPHASKSSWWNGSPNEVRSSKEAETDSVEFSSGDQPAGLGRGDTYGAIEHRGGAAEQYKFSVAKHLKMSAAQAAEEPGWLAWGYNFR